MNGGASFLQLEDGSEETGEAQEGLVDAAASVYDLDDRSVRAVESKAVLASSGRSSFFGWVKNVITASDSSQADTMSAADSLGGSDDEANYSLGTESFWLLTCVGGLVFFSCIMICGSRVTATYARARLLTGKEPEVDGDTSEEPVEGLLDTTKPEEDKPKVLTLQEVIDAAAQKIDRDTAAAGGVEVGELLSAVASLGADAPTQQLALSKSYQEVSGGSDTAADSNTTCEQAMSVPLLTEDVLQKLEATGACAGGYDCVLVRPPLNFSQVVRLHAKILQPASGEMMAPLAQQMCVLFQVTVSRRLHAGMPPAPVAFSSMSSAKFHIAPVQKPHLSVAVEGADVMLFDTVVGQFSYKGAFADAPGHLQDYVLTHRSAVPGGPWQTSATFRADTNPLDFEECALLVGSQVTVIGELARDPGGGLVLRSASNLSDSPRVLVSDDPKLYEQVHC
jgi:hypothetical protein